MDALKIALDTLIVGALAAPWLLLLIDFFFPVLKEEGNAKGKRGLDHLLSMVGEKNRGTVAIVLLAAIAYLLGAGVARVAEDYFNDDDNRANITENDIRASVYCEDNERQIIMDAGDMGVAGLSSRKHNGAPCSDLKKFKKVLADAQSDKATKEAAREAIDADKGQIEQIFHLQEGALLLDGEDKVSRLRYLRQQIVVLRGAAFNGMITCLLCLFGWCATYGPWTRRVLAVLPIAVATYAVYILILHSTHMAFDDPPSMEISLLAIGMIGCCLLLWKEVQPRPYLAGFFLAALLAGIAYSGWWRTEILYDRLVINVFYAQSHGLLKPIQ
jgi:hypothetical protein